MVVDVKSFLACSVIGKEPGREKITTEYLHADIMQHLFLPSVNINLCITLSSLGFSPQVFVFVFVYNLEKFNKSVFDRFSIHSLLLMGERLNGVTFHQGQELQGEHSGHFPTLSKASHP